MASLETWAAANPAARDALLEVAEQAVALQPAAELVIQLARHPDHHGQPDWETEQQRVEEAYRVLRAQLDSLWVEEPLAALLERHVTIVAGATTTPAEGLGPVAGELVAFRDRLRSTVPVQGREVEDLRSDKLL
jgi:hypothetical protein